MSRLSRVAFAAAGLSLVLSLATQAQAPPPPQGPPAVQAPPAAQTPPAGRGQGRGRGAVALPEGAGKAVVETGCVGCHQPNAITGSAGFTREGWRDLISTMVRLPDADLTTVTDYLATNFPERPGRRPTLVPGDVMVSFMEWVVPTLGQRARDPIQLPDGMIWWAGQFASLVGRLNPRTGEMREFKLDPTARPHSVIADRDGFIWYMGNANGTIGKLNPANGDITVIKMPDPAARDPHTPYFDQQGNLWFTLQNSNMVGRLVPSTGAITFVTLPTPNARPYGMAINAQGIPFIAYNGSHKIARIDPATMTVREFALPTTGSRIRRLDLLSDGTIFYVDAARGRLGRMDPNTGDFREWLSPSGAESEPYAIAVVNDIVWYNESSRRPDALVRFDPKTEKFQSWAIPSGVGIIRHMRATPDGNLAIHQGSTNRIGLVTIGK
jgi:virginiamycin B lyase